MFLDREEMDEYNLERIETQAYAQLSLVNEVRRLKRENEHLKQQVKRYDNYMSQSIKNSEKLFGEVLTGMVNNITK